MGKVVVLEVVIPELDAEAIEEIAGEGPILFEVLGFVSNEVMVTHAALDLEDDEFIESLDSLRGFVVRTRINDEEWVTMTRDVKDDDDEDVVK